MAVMEGMLICFEGIDGSGKATQSQLLKKELEAKGRKCMLLSYPDYTSEYGKMIDRHLHGGATLSVPELFLLFLADMLKDSDRVNGAIAKGQVVIMDRYFYSTIAYQCAAGFDYERAKAIEAAAGLTVPSVVLYLDIPASLTHERKMKQKQAADRNESNMKYMDAVRAFYGKLLSERYSRARWVRIDGTETIEQIQEEIMKEIGK